jgi:putative PIN family toxin of toxin-antitoxin system
VRVVLDSNIYVAALTLPGGRADAAVAAALAGRYVALLSEPMLGEILGVLGRKFARHKDELARVAVFLSDLTDHVSPRTRLSVLADDADNRILECAREGGGEIIVTGDKAMLRLGRFESVEILSLRAFLTRLDTSD